MRVLFLTFISLLSFFSLPVFAGVLTVADTLVNQFDSKGRKEGVWEKRRPNGRLLYRAEYRAGELVGRTTRYDEFGRVESTIDYRDAHVAYVCLYDDRGRKQGEGLFYDRQKDSIWRYWSGDLLVRVEGWKRGVKHGVFEVYSSSGKLAERQNWKDGRLHGLQELYYASGALRMVSRVENDVPVGVTYTYFSNGLVRSSGQYKDGLREGEWKIWDIDGKLESVTTYDRGRIVGGDTSKEVSDQLDALFRNIGKIPEPEQHSPF